jgi:hypothetical protein
LESSKQWVFYKTARDLLRRTKMGQITIDWKETARIREEVIAEQDIEIAALKKRVRELEAFKSAWLKAINGGEEPPWQREKLLSLMEENTALREALAYCAGSLAGGPSDLPKLAMKVVLGLREALDRLNLVLTMGHTIREREAFGIVKAALGQKEGV